MSTGSRKGTHLGEKSQNLETQERTPVGTGSWRRSRRSNGDHVRILGGPFHPCSRVRISKRCSKQSSNAEANRKVRSLSLPLILLKRPTLTTWSCYPRLWYLISACITRYSGWCRSLENWDLVSHHRQGARTESVRQHPPTPAQTLPSRGPSGKKSCHREC